jgi:hypothetical protein
MLRSALFWDIMRRPVIIVYRRFGTTYQSYLQGSRVRAVTTLTDYHPARTFLCRSTSRCRLSFLLGFLTLEDGTDTLSRNIVNNYHTTPRNVSEERRSQQHRGGSLKLNMLFSCLPVTLLYVYNCTTPGRSVPIVTGLPMV